MKDRLLDMQGAADYLGISPRTLERWVYTGKVPHTKILGSVRFTAEHMALIVAAGEKPAASVPPRKTAARSRL